MSSINLNSNDMTKRLSMPIPTQNGNYVRRESSLKGSKLRIRQSARNLLTSTTVLPSLSKIKHSTESPTLLHDTSHSMSNLVMYKDNFKESNSYKIKNNQNLFEINNVRLIPRAKVDPLPLDAQHAPSFENDIATGHMNTKFIESHRNHFLHRRSSSTSVKDVQVQTETPLNNRFEFDSVNAEHQWFSDIVEPFLMDLRESICREKPRDIHSYVASYCYSNQDGSNLSSVHRNHHHNSKQIMDTNKSVRIIKLSNY